MHRFLRCWQCAGCAPSCGFVRVLVGLGMRCCSTPDEGLVVARCSFANNTAALTGVCPIC
jgi:hypothetical protein